MGAKSRTYFFIVFLQMLNMISCQEVAKRVPQGFLGVRGKKYYENEVEHFYKRKPQFFVGVKGKKSLLDYLQSNYDHEYYKRAPMGFIGMRGKKDSNDFAEPNPFSDSFEYVPKRGSLIGQIDYSAEEVPQIDYPYLFQIIKQYQEQNEQSELENNSFELNGSDGHTAMLTKRAAHMNQFFGVRGKKGANKRPFDLSFRGKFVGVRGKKDVRNSGINEIKFLLNKEAPWPKRKGQMNGFFGMRGKKWVDDSSTEALN